MTETAKPTPVLTPVLTGADVGTGALTLVGLLQTFSEHKLDKFEEADLKAGVDFLRQAGKSDSKAEQISQIREARNSFTKAVNVTDGSGKAITLLGRSCCHYWLGDETNSKDDLNAILNIDPITTLRILLAEMNKYSDPVFAHGGLVGATVGPVIVISFTRAVRLLTGSESRKRHRKELCLKAVSEHEDLRIVKNIQDATSAYLNKPIPWVKALD